MKAVIVWCVVMFLTLVFAVASFIYGPPVTPPKHMRTDEVYWYGDN